MENVENKSKRNGRGTGWVGRWVSRGGGTNEISRSRSVLSVSRALKQLVAASKGGGTCGGRIGGEGR